MQVCVYCGHETAQAIGCEHCQRIREERAASLNHVIIDGAALAVIIAVSLALLYL